MTNLSLHEKRIAGFCADWKAGKETFEITTSGSTGTPKQIILHREQMIAGAMKTAKELDLKKGMTCLVCIDTNYIGGLMMLVRAMVIDMKIMVAEPSATPLENIKEHIDFTAMVPYQVLNTGNDEFTGKVIIGGAPVNIELQEKVKGIKSATFYATFGMTETLSHIALQRLNGNNPDETFRTLEGVDISTDDRQCLIINADHLTGTVVTNDIVEIINPKEFKWLGRYDNIINSGGVKVMPEKIERSVGEWLSSNGCDNHFFVTGIAHERLGTQVTLVIEGRLFKEAEMQLLLSLRDTLGKYEVPKTVLYASKFTYTATQKIDRTATIKNALPRPGL